MIFPGETQDATPTDIVSKHFFKAFQPLNQKIGLTGRQKDMMTLTGITSLLFLHFSSMKNVAYIDIYSR